MMINRVGTGLGATVLAAAMAAGAVAILPGTAVAVSGDGGDTEGVLVTRAPGEVRTWTGEVWTVRGCAYGLFLPAVGMSCHYEVLV